MTLSASHDRLASPLSLRIADDNPLARWGERHRDDSGISRDRNQLEPSDLS